VIFSSRFPPDLSSSELFLAFEKKQSGILDLTISNPFRCGIEYPKDIPNLLAVEGVLSYEPDAHGLLSARQAVSRELIREGLAISDPDIFLTSGTSEAYSFIFKLLADPGLGILFPAPGYPLLEHLIRADGLDPVAYQLAPREGWPLDRQSLEKTPKDSIKALIVISPHNPTGTYLSGDDRAFLDTLCAQNGWALILDEVFYGYHWFHKPDRYARAPQALTFVLGGLSKSCGLPQMKCSWIGLQGPALLVDKAREGLDFLADQYLSVGTPVQAALPALLQKGTLVRERIRARVLSNLAVLNDFKERTVPGIRFWPAQGGWAALIQADPGAGDETAAFGLLDKGVWAMPGSYFDFSMEGFWVISLLVDPDSFKKGIQILLGHLSR
jgi:hypothetical protein